jgi:predicted nucleic acid-binding protein
LIYLDTSMVVSLYCLDANSAAATKLLSTIKDKLLITTLVELEAINAFGLKEFRQEITRSQAEASHLNFDRAVRSGVFQIRELPESAFARGSQLSRKLTPQLGTRTADLLHVAAALELGASGFFSFDQQQRRMAEATGLKLNSLL